MANFLYRLSNLIVRRRLTVTAIWLLILVAVGASAAAFSGPVSNSFTIPGTESQQAIDLLSEKFPGTGGASARVVVAAPPGHTLDEPAYRDVGQKALEQAKTAPQVIAVTGFDQGTLSPDKRILFGDIKYAVTVDKISDEAKAALQDAAEPARAAGLQVEFSGGVISTTEAAGHSSELYGIVIAFVVLAITFGALVAAGMPLLTAAVGVGIGLLGIQALSSVVEVNSTTPTLALMLGLAVGIDYALFIVSRHRQQLRDGMPVAESIKMATATAGGAVVFAGLTVVIALAGLSVVGIPFLTAMGVAAAGTVAVAVLISITLVPALLALLGPRINSGRIGPLARRQDKADPAAGFGRRWAEWVTAKPLVTALLCVAAVGALAYPALDLELGLPDDSSKSTDTTERRAYDLLAEGFGPGFNGPLTLVVYVPGRTDVAQLTQQGIDQTKEEIKGIAAITPPVPNQAGDVAIVSVVPSSGPATEATSDLVHDLRKLAAEVRDQSDAQVYVTGPTASNIDVSDKLGAALPVFLVLIVGLALVLLTLVFRSILVPAKAIAGFLLSIGGSMGLTVAVFQWGHLDWLFKVETPGPIVSFLPVLLVGILFGLAMDYEVFLVTRIREEYVHTNDPTGSIEDGMSHSARVVTAAALIMISVFGSFIFADDAVIKSIGLALAVGVAIDAFIVRMTLVPAGLKLLGHSAWWLPKWLDRAMPDLDIEGSKLAAQQE
ncbi:MMPL family transporter [Antrihabitans sp. YC2-6]|uniref:MMPL family transporter n=1 Tax=Antrihabitans sp. YC2-6 TaxID=2799498 RepID=UPI0018F435FF|nr:MMPL family transporter [Antrihabitans sp. YC2-6]MBJ8346278.1 MMPL family transporter [Antrihabitans sp. YC2-6]